MIRAALTVNENKNVTGALATNAGEVKLKAVIGNATFGTGSTYQADTVSLSLEKPGTFSVFYDVIKRNVRFQFNNTVNILEKKLNWTYTHSRNENQTVLDGTLVLDQANKLFANYELGSRNRKIKYSYTNKGITTFEPSYDFAKNSWDLALSRKFTDGTDQVKATYEMASKKLGLELSCQSSQKNDVISKISATFNLAEGLRMPNLCVESSWYFEM